MVPRGQFNFEKYHNCPKFSFNWPPSHLAIQNTSYLNKLVLNFSQFAVINIMFISCVAEYRFFSIFILNRQEHAYMLYVHWKSM